jgi:MFS family permease
VVAFGIVSGIAGVFVLLAYPLTGALSDRTTSRFGRRRPWIAIGALVFAGSLVFLGFQKDIVGIGIGWTVALLGFCVMTAALTATISDQVPVNQRGVISGWISAPQAIGIILGLVLVSDVFHGRVVGYSLMAAILVVLTIPFVLRLNDQVLPPNAKPRLTLGGWWISPRQYPDFGWTLLSRILVNLGNAFGTTLLYYFLEYHIKVADPDSAIIQLSLVYMVFVIIASLALGRLSDRIGRRKVFVWLASALQGIAAIVLAFIPHYSVALLGALLLGLGYGCFLSVDQALATQVLPDPADRGKDLGIMNIATAFPQAIAPLLGAFLVAYAGGFATLYVVAGITSLIGAACVLPIRQVK